MGTSYSAEDIGSQCLVNYYKRYINGFNQNAIGAELKYSVKHSCKNLFV